MPGDMMVKHWIAALRPRRAKGVPMTDKMEFFATCPKGFEQILSDELSALGIPHVRPLRGQVSFGEELADAYRACLWSRMASRVILVIGRIDASDADALYEGLSQMAWEDHVSLGATIAIDAHGTNDQLRNTQFVALKSKDAIVDRLMSRRGSRPMVNTERPDVSVVVRLSRDRATVGIDLSGAPLFRRGYESARSGRAPIAPLRPDYAAALLASGGWFRSVRHDSPTIAAAYSGAGTVLVEAAAQALDRAPGLLRARWGFDGWAGHDQKAWESLLDEARERAERSKDRKLTILACETRPGAEASLRQELRAAGMRLDVSLVAPSDVARGLEHRKGTLAVCDLSWVAQDEVAQQASALAVASTAVRGADTIVAITRDQTIDAALGGVPEATEAVFVGQDPATIRTYDGRGLSPAREQVNVADRDGRQRHIPVFVGASEQFARRLAKVWRQRRKWAQREDVSCYRIYDTDLPDYAVTIDLFEESELIPARNGRGRWLLVSEYAAPKDVDPNLARERLLDVLAIAPVVIGVEPQNVFVRVRTHGKGGSQYASEAKANTGEKCPRDARPGRARRASKPGFVPLAPGAHLVDEGGLTFEVNFSLRHDCGIFLDHREARSLVREMMKQTQGSKRFLNLFSYTGTATCYAADGGAKHTTTVDMSRPSLEWAKRNMERNGFVNEGRDVAHEYVQADVIRWVSEQRRTKNRWDLIFCDVPTFSNSSRMRKGSWDVQRDHAELIIGISRLLTRNGCAIFSCNLRRFRPDVQKLQKVGVSLEDITQQTIPEDFSRNTKVHHAYIVRRTLLPGRDAQATA